MAVLSFAETEVVLIPMATICSFIGIWLLITQCACCQSETERRKKGKRKLAAGRKRSGAKRTSPPKEIEAEEGVAEKKLEREKEEKVKHADGENRLSAEPSVGDVHEKDEAAFNVVPRGNVMAVGPPTAVVREPSAPLWDLPAFTIQTDSRCDTVRDLRNRQTFRATKRGSPPSKMRRARKDDRPSPPSVARTRPSSPEGYTSLPSELFYNKAMRQSSTAGAVGPPELPRTWFKGAGNVPTGHKTEPDQRPPHAPQAVIVGPPRSPIQGALDASKKPLAPPPSPPSVPYTGGPQPAAKKKAAYSRMV